MGNYDSILQLIKTRQSCRDYQDKAVNRADIEKLLDAGRMAPSACNSQPWHFVAIDGQEASKMPQFLKRGRVNSWTECVKNYIIITETKAVLFSGATCDSQHYAQLDLGISTGYMTLAATALGLSTCILGCFDEDGLKETYNIPKNVTIRLVLAVGYASETEKIRDKSRKPKENLISFNKFE